MDMTNFMQKESAPSVNHMYVRSKNGHLSFDVRVGRLLVKIKGGKIKNTLRMVIGGGGWALKPVKPILYGIRSRQVVITSDYGLKKIPL